MNLDELQSVRDRERQTDKLQQLRESFYEEAGEFIQQLQTERERAAERADNPFDSPQVKQLSDEITTAEQTVEAIYEKRIGKLVKAASLDAAGLPSEADGLTAEEQDLFEALVADIKAHRTRVLDVIEGTVDGKEPDTSNEASDQHESESAPASDGVSAADVMGGGPESAEARSDGQGPPDSPQTPPDQTRTGRDSATQQAPPDQPDSPQPETQRPPQSVEPPVRNDGGLDTVTGTGADTVAASDGSEGVERETILLTDDVDTFVGFDGRDYDLGSNDIVTLPSTNATLLVDKDVARPLD